MVLTPPAKQRLRPNFVNSLFFSLVQKAHQDYGRMETPQYK